MSFDEQLLDRVDRQGSTPFSGEVYRYTTARRDPLSGAGARLNGGRWNPKDIFATIYLAIPPAACMGELERAAESQDVTVDDMLEVPYRFHVLTVNELRVLDLRSPAALAAVGLTEADISDPDWTACQAVGHAAWFLGLGGLIAPSASGTGQVLAAFEGRLGPGQLAVERSEPLTLERYHQLSH